MLDRGAIAAARRLAERGWMSLSGVARTATRVIGIRRGGAWSRWRRRVRRALRRRRERWTELLTDAPFEERVATGLVRYLKNPTRETEHELEEGVSGLLRELLDEALGDAAPEVEMLSSTRFEVTSPTSIRLVGYAGVPVGHITRYRLRPFMADLARPPATSRLHLAGEEDEIDEPEDLRPPPAVALGAGTWPHAFEGRLRETWATRVLPVLAPPEDQASPGERVARALVDYLDRPSQDAADEIAGHLYWLWYQECWHWFGEEVPTLDGPFEAERVEVLSRTAIRLTADPLTFDGDANQWEYPVSVKLALPLATSTIQMDADERHVATFVLPPPPD